MDGVSTQPSDNRTLEEKFNDLVKSFPLNTYWKIEDGNYVWIHGYSISRSNYLFPSVLSLRFDDKSLDILCNSFLSENDVKNGKQITKEEFVDIENKMITGFSKITDYVRNNIELYKSKYFFNELKVGSKYIYILNKSVVRIVEILDEIPNEYNDYKKDYKTNQRQFTSSLRSDYLYSEDERERSFYLCIFDLCEWTLNDYTSSFYLINDDEWNKINNTFDTAKNYLIK